MEFSVAPGVFRSLPPSLLINARSIYPGIELEQVEIPDRDCEDYVHADPGHFAISTKPWYDTGLFYRPIHREPLYFIASREHPLADRPEIRLEDLRDEKFLFFNNKYNIHYRTFGSCKACGYQPNIIYKSADVSQLVNLAVLKLGILICVKHVYEEAARDKLVCIPIANEEMYWELGILYQDFSRLDANAKLFLNYIYANVQKLQGATG